MGGIWANRIKTPRAQRTPLSLQAQFAFTCRVDENLQADAQWFGSLLVEHGFACVRRGPTLTRKGCLCPSPHHSQQQLRAALSSQVSLNATSQERDSLKSTQKRRSYLS